jgi:hypothetical protein
MDTLKKAWPIIKKVLLVFLLLYVAVSVYLLYENWKNPRVVTVTQKAAESVPATEKNLDIGEKPATNIVKYITLAEAGKEKPVAEFTIAGKTVESAAATVAAGIKDNNQNLAAAALEKTDKTEVVADTTNQKVDVYKIDLKHKHEVKAGMTVADSHVYADVGYQAGRVEGIVHMNGQGIKGGTVMYTLAEW